MSRIVPALMLPLAAAGSLAVGSSSSAATHSAPSRVVSPTLELIAQDFAIEPDQPLAITFLPPEPLVAGDTVRIEAYQALEDRSLLTTFIDDYDALGSASDSLSFELEAVTVQADGSVAVSVPTESATRSDAAIQFPNQGLYPVLVRVVDQSSATRGEVLTFVDRRPLPSAEPRGTLGIASVASISAPPLIPGSNTPLPAAVDDQIEQVIDYPESLALTMAISPDVLTRLDPDTLERIRPVLARSVAVSTPSFPFDPSSAADADLHALFKDVLVEGEDITDAIGEVQTDRSVWLASGPITTSGAALLRDGGARMLVLTPEVYKSADGNIGDFFDYSQLLQTRLEVTSEESDLSCTERCMPTAVLDPDFEALMLDDALEPERRAVYLSAHLVVWRDSLAANLSPVTGHTLVLGMSDGSVPDPVTMTRVMEMALPTGAIEVTDLRDFDRKTTPQLVGGNEIVITLAPTVPVDISQRPAELLPVAATAIGVGSMLVTPAGRPERWQSTLETMYSTALSDADVDATVASLNSEFDTIMAAVVPRTPESFTLSGRQTDVRLRFSNTGAEILRVVVQLDAGADKLEFPDGPQLVELQPGTNEVAVTVEARANGSVTVNLNVITPEGGVRIVPTIAMQAKVNSFTGLAQVITGAALLMLLTWWVHNVRTSRRKRRRDAAEALGGPELAGAEVALPDAPDDVPVVVEPDSVEDPVVVDRETTSSARVSDS